MGADYHAPPLFWQEQIDIFLDQAAPNVDQWYDVLELTGGGIGIRSISPAITIANETVQVEILIDGITRVAQAAMVVGTRYMVANRVYAAEPVFAAGADIPPMGLWKCHSLRVRIRKITALGAGNLQCRLKYQALRPL